MSACFRRPHGRTVGAALLCGIAATVASAARASEQPEVRIADKQGAMVVRADVPVAVGAATAWAVLTDYNRLAEFVPDMQVSRIVSEPGRPLLLEQRGEAGFLIFRTEMRVILQVEETPPVRIAFRAVAGDFKRMQGEWGLLNEGRSVRLSYRAEIEPDFWVPPLIGRELLRSSVQRQISGVVQEMLRRHAGAGAGIQAPNSGTRAPDRAPEPLPAVTPP